MRVAVVGMIRCGTRPAPAGAGSAVTLAAAALGRLMRMGEFRLVQNCVFVHRWWVPRLRPRRHRIGGRRRLVSRITPFHNFVHLDNGPSVMDGALQTAL